MTVQLTIIGLGQIGASVGLSLANQQDQITRLGHDRDPNIARHAQGLGAVDKIVFNLPSSVENAELVILALPFDQIRDTLQVVGPFLQENAVVMDTSPLKNKVAEWAKEFLPANCHYVGLIPALNPLYLRMEEKGTSSAHADLFSGGLMGVTAPQGTSGAAIKLASDLASLLGASPLYVDLVEADGLMASIHLVPQLTAAILANLAMDRPGWKDARKLTGRLFSEVTLPVQEAEENSSLVAMSIYNNENVARVLDEMIVSLEELRDYVKGSENEKLFELLEHARSGRSKWWQERKKGDWLSLDKEQLGIIKGNLWNRLFGDMGKLFGPPQKKGDDRK